MVERIAIRGIAERDEGGRYEVVSPMTVTREEESWLANIQS
jgi:hypothetical protein